MLAVHALGCRGGDAVMSQARHDKSGGEDRRRRGSARDALCLRLVSCVIAQIQIRVSAGVQCGGARAGG
jgi:hypothetical protein